MSTFFLALFLGWLLGLATPPFYKWIVKKVTKPSDVAGVVLLMFVLTSCGTTTGDPFKDTISFSQAWGHVIQYSSYWLWLLASAVPLTVYVIYVVKNKNSQLNLPILFFLLALLAAGILYAPAECAANTTIEMAARGAFIR